MLVVVGYVLVIAAILGGFLLAGGHIAVLMQPVELLIIFGSAGGAFLVSNSPKALKATIQALPTILKGSRYDKALYLETLSLLYNIFARVRKEGLLAIEGTIEAPEESDLFQAAPMVLADHHAVEFITDYLRMMVSGNLEVHEMDNLMDIDIETHHHETEVPVHALQRFADGLPAFGIVAAVLGVVHTMESVGLPPAELGKLIAAALVGTFLGILMAYAFVGPLASALSERAQESTKYFQSIKVCLIAYMNGYNPQTAVEFGRKVLFSTERPGFMELEAHLKGK
ncbi:flagellar motor stator protein MotA [Thermithiobacillus plumbiphilus]|uniref:Flagellar motor stator protein MotA n=1 Tax=Thermithiobacillus plumbiphilus TaxID=1729899 RepID=A0ABU9DAV2_9PROT